MQDHLCSKTCHLEDVWYCRPLRDKGLEERESHCCKSLIASCPNIWESCIEYTVCSICMYVATTWQISSYPLPQIQLTFGKKWFRWNISFSAAVSCIWHSFPIWDEHFTEMFCGWDAPEPPWSEIPRAASSLHIFYFFSVLIKCGNLPSWQGSGRQTILWIANLAPTWHFSPSKHWAKKERNEGLDTPWWMWCIGWVRMNKYSLSVLGGKWSFTFLLRAYLSPWA